MTGYVGALDGEEWLAAKACDRAPYCDHQHYMKADDLCELVGCPRAEEWGVSFESRTGERMWFRVCEEHAEEIRGNHRGDGWYVIPLAERMA